MGEAISGNVTRNNGHDAVMAPKIASFLAWPQECVKHAIAQLKEAWRCLTRPALGCLPDRLVGIYRMDKHASKGDRECGSGQGEQGMKSSQRPSLSAGRLSCPSWPSYGFDGTNAKNASIVFSASLFDANLRKPGQQGQANARNCNLLTAHESSVGGNIPHVDMDSRPAFSRLGLFRMRMDV
jgi:hypothetical protein